MAQVQMVGFAGTTFFGEPHPLTQINMPIAISKTRCAVLQPRRLPIMDHPNSP
jgi:hypothetical protein